MQVGVFFTFDSNSEIKVKGSLLKLCIHFFFPILNIKFLLFLFALCCYFLCSLYVLYTLVEFTLLDEVFFALRLGFSLLFDHY